jgi:hypothetical protein
MLRALCPISHEKLCLQKTKATFRHRLELQLIASLASNGYNCYLQEDGSPGRDAMHLTRHFVFGALFAGTAFFLLRSGALRHWLTSASRW